MDPALSGSHTKQHRSHVQSCCALFFVVFLNYGGGQGVTAPGAIWNIADSPCKQNPGIVFQVGHTSMPLRLPDPTSFGLDHLIENHLCNHPYTVHETELTGVRLPLTRQPSLGLRYQVGVLNVIAGFARARPRMLPRRPAFGAFRIGLQT